MLAEIGAHNSEDLITLCVALFGLLGCGLAVYLAYVGNHIGAIVALFVGVVLLVVALG